MHCILSRYNLVFLGLTYLVPVIAMAVCYTLMGRELWGSRSIGELTQRQIDSIKSKRKVGNCSYNSEIMVAAYR
jgi:tachykinin-like receptor